ncbi:MAG TPA: L,D-transpeptidase family protein, partial [Chryseolinea sp.]
MSIRVQYGNAIVVALLISAACRTQNVTLQHVPVIASTVVAVKPIKPIALPRDPSDSLYKRLVDCPSVVHFYRERNFSTAWFDSLRHPTAKADSMMSIIRNARYFGLLPGRYHLNELDQLKDSRKSPYPERTEVLLTDAFLRLANDLRRGVSMVHEGADSVSVDLLHSALREGEIVSALNSVEPGYSQYKALKHAIQEILDSTNASTKGRILSGEISDVEPTMKMLQAVEVNLERWRVEKHFMEAGRYVRINIPSFMLHVMSDGKPVLESRIIVGTQETPTPAFNSMVECFTLYPYWYVPRKISVEEFLPIIQHDTSFVTRNNFDVLDRQGRVLRADSIDWMTFNKNNFPVSLRQREGEGNSLGIIKFVFDNPYAVFLHDTNAKALFKRQVRMFSHGCIRMEKAFEMAHYLLTNDPSKRSAALDKYLAKQERRTVNLPSPVPIYIHYFTCEVVNGRLYRYEDVYDRDERLRE